MCGIFGVVGKGLEVSKMTYLGLYALQHRGQESAGIAVINKDKAIDFHKGMGLVSQVFNENVLRGLDGDMAIGHVRYSTTGSSQIKNAQPIIVELKDGTIAIAHNGNLVNTPELRAEFFAEESAEEMTSDSGLIGKMIAKMYDGDLHSTLIKVSAKLKGAFSLIVMAQDKIIGIRDSYGIRPLCFGKLPDNKGFVIASESCALDIVGAELVREVQKGEMVTLDKDGVHSLVFDKSKEKALCVFEYIYFARPDSYIDGKNIYRLRERMGMQLAASHPVEADMVISVPDSGTPAAIGYAKASGIPYEEGLIKNRYVGRTFINPSQLLRELGVRIKLNPLKEILNGKRVIVVDDSIVRGTTSAKIVKLIRDAGAKEVHFRVSSPPNISPCFYGIDTATKKELIAANNAIEEIRKKLNVESLGYLSIDGLFKAIETTQKHYCLGCFDGCYPEDIPEQDRLDLVFKS